MGAKGKPESNMRGVRFAQDRSRETLQRILDAAEEVFAESGYNRATVAEIISRAGIGHGTFWLYFRNKDDLLRYMVQDMVNEIAAFDWYSLDDVKKYDITSLARVEEIIRGVMSVFIRYSGLHPLIVQASLQSQEFHETLEELNKPFNQLLEIKLREHLERGLCRDIDPTVTAQIIVTMIEYTNLRWVNQEIVTDQESLIHALSVIIHHTLNH